MKIVSSKNILTKKIGSSGVVLDLTSYKPYILNKTAYRILKFLTKPKKIKEIENYLVKNFNIDNTKAKRDIKSIIGSFYSKDLISKIR